MMSFTKPKFIFSGLSFLFLSVVLLLYVYRYHSSHAIKALSKVGETAPKQASPLVIVKPGTSSNGPVFANAMQKKHRDLDENEEHGDPDEKGGMDKKALVEGAFKLEFKKTRDVKTNTIPKNRLITAAKYADNLKVKSGAITQGTQGALTGLTWVERGPNNIGGRTRAILPDLNDATGNTVWAGSVSGGLWKTTNALKAAPGNPLWQPVNNFFQNLVISCITQNPQNPKLIYFGTGEGWYNGDALAGDGLWKSADGGNTWNQVASTGDSISNNTFYHVQKVLDYTVKGTEYLFACTRGNGVQLSIDGGLTWTEVLGFGLPSFVNQYGGTDIERGADGSLYASMGIFQQGGIYKSQDNGTTWVQLSNGLPASGYERVALACAPSDSLRVYALLQDANADTCLGVYRSDSAGRVWYPVTDPSIYNGGNFAGSQAWYALTIGVDPNNANRVIVGGLDLAASKDGGNTWNIISQWYGGGGYQYVHADHHAIVFAPGSSNNIYFGNDGGLFTTTNGSATVPTITQIDSSYNVTQFYHAAISPVPNSNYMIAGAQDNGNDQFTKAGMNPGYNFTGGDGAYVHIDDDNPNTQVAAYVYSSYYISTDGFSSQNYRNVTVGNSNGLFINPTDYDSRDKILYGADAAGSYNLVSNVGTTNATSINAIPNVTDQVTAVRVSPNKRHRVFFGVTGYYTGNNATLFVVDSANTATPVAKEIDGGAFTNSGAYLSCIAVEPGNDNHVLVCFSNYGLQGQSIWETKNGGATWASIAGNLPDMPIRSICFKPFSNMSAIVGTDLGVWSTDTIKGASTVWGESNTGLARVSADWVDYRKSDGTLFAATHGRGLYTSTSFNKPVISYVKSDTTVNRTDAKTNGTDCKLYQDIWLSIQLSSAPSASAQVKVTASSGSLVQGVDYDVLIGGSGNLAFSAPGVQQVRLRLYNTQGPTANDTISVGLALVNGSGTNAIVTPFPDFNSFTVFINNQQPTNLPVQTAVDTLTTTSQFVGPNRTAYFYDGTPAGHLIASVKNNSNTSLGCIKLAVDRAGNNGNVPFNINDSANYLASKTVRLIAADTASSGLNYTLTLYYTGAEVSTWAAGTKGSPSSLKVIGVKNHPISSVTPSSTLSQHVFVATTTQGAYNSTGYMFSANFTSIDSLQGFGIGDSANSTLPITLLSFQGILDKGNAVLTWKTASEINNLGFAVQRSTDGSTFSQIGFVNGNGTTGLTSNYTFTDAAMPDGVVFYRLKQVDFDGRYSYSSIVVLAKDIDGNSVSVTENPFHSQVGLVFKGNLAGTAIINVFDMTGKKVYAASKNVQSTVPLEIGNLSKGVYVVRVLWNTKTYTIKVIRN